jgi:hypothetical protein
MQGSIWVSLRASTSPNSNLAMEIQRVTDEHDALQPQETPEPSRDNEIPVKRELPAAAVRALREAEERRRAASAQATTQEPEVGGRDGPDPARYGDWEKGGIASDF